MVRHCSALWRQANMDTKSNSISMKTNVKVGFSFWTIYVSSSNIPNPRLITATRPQNEVSEFQNPSTASISKPTTKFPYSDHAIHVNMCESYCVFIVSSFGALPWNPSPEPPAETNAKHRSKMQIAAGARLFACLYQTHTRLCHHTALTSLVRYVTRSDVS